MRTPVEERQQKVCLSTSWKNEIAGTTKTLLILIFN